MTLSGAEFKVRYPGPYYKFLGSKLRYRGFTYQLGLNVETKKFNSSVIYQEEIFNFFNDEKDFIRFYINGPLLGIIDIPDDALVYVSENGFKSDKLIISRIVYKEDELIEFFKIAEDRIDFNSKDICHYAGKYGHLEILKWARENGSPWTGLTCECAAANGHLEVLKWAIENDCPWNKSVLIHAIIYDYFEMFKWLVAMDCPWDEDTSTMAVKYNRFEILKWARENGCPWDENTYHHAYYGGNKKILKYLEENGCPR